jgi:very-long-chain enoyl-CoA reductase
VLHTLHYAKRLLETIFVHRFSNGTMPLSNLFKNCWYYWFFGAALGYAVNHPLYTPPPAAVWPAAGAAAFALAELGNLHCHLTLRWLRPPGTRVRRVPRGVWFSLVSCPNYTFEVAAWAAFSAATWTAAGLAFLGVGAAQMTVWALKKHRNYRREFKDYPRGRKAIFPFVI